MIEFKEFYSRTSDPNLPKYGDDGLININLELIEYFRLFNTLSLIVFGIIGAIVVLIYLEAIEQISLNINSLARLYLRCKLPPCCIDPPALGIAADIIGLISSMLFCFINIPLDLQEANEIKITP